MALVLDLCARAITPPMALTISPMTSTPPKMIRFRAYRKRKRMTQKQLAQLLETHANTISSWELGTYLPQTRGLVLELARHLGLNDQETRPLLGASLTAL